MKLVWYINRLKMMGVREATHRLYEQFDLYRLRLTQAQRERTHHDFLVNDFSFCRGANPLLPALDWDFEINKQTADTYLLGHWPALGFDWHWKSQGHDWHRAPDSGKQWPRKFFGSIPYREGNPYGDVRVVWEPSRLQQLVSLALLSADESYRNEAVDLFEAQLQSWVAANPPYIGIHYVSAMECALRLLAVCYATDLVRPYLKTPESVWQAVLHLVQSHGNLIERRLSLYSSAGNHTIAETAGLVYAGMLFPEFKEARCWERIGLKLLLFEANRQFLPDGGGIEQTFSYHIFTTDLCNLVVQLLKSRGEEHTELLEIVTKAKKFLSELLNSLDELPTVGDDDGGSALSKFLRISYLPRLSNTTSVTFPDAGYSLLRIGAKQEGLLLFDHGPLGMSPAYAHGHSDCLSICLRLGTQDILIDSGTFTYTGDPRWRRYFRGVAAHNTVAIDGRDQAIQQSVFMWSNPFHVHVVHRDESSDGTILILARHNGYEKPLGVTHWRAVFYNPPNYWFVWDCVTGDGTHGLELTWHLGIDPNLEGSIYGLHGIEHSAYLEINGGPTTLHRGETNPIRGWRSCQYGTKEPITTLRTEYHGTLPHEFITQMWLENTTRPNDSLSPKLAMLRGLVGEA